MDCTVLTGLDSQLDQNNVSNAYVSGMETELGFGPGNELSWMNTYFAIGTIIGGTFSNLIITVVRPSYWLPGCLGVWSLFVLGLFRCQTATEFYVLRFFVGAFESAAWPGVSKSIRDMYDVSFRCCLKRHASSCIPFLRDDYS